MIVINNKSYLPSDFIILKNELRDLIDKNELWLSMKQLGIILKCSDDNIGIHIRNLYKTKELDPVLTSKQISISQLEKNRFTTRKIKLFNYDVVISLSYRINSESAIELRKRSRKILSEYMVQGISISDDEDQQENVIKR